MARSYYYLVAGLPEIALDAGKLPLTVSEFIAETQEQIHEKDTVLFDLLQYEHDNKNLLAALERTEQEFDANGVFSQEELEQEIKNPECLPEYAQTFMEAHKEGRSIFPDMSWENQLTKLFYQWVLDSPRPFIREWFNFELDLRNVLAGLNARQYADKVEGDESPFAMARAIITANDTAEYILKSNAPDFGLTADLRWVEKVTGLDRNNLVEFDKAIDILRWDTLNDLTTFTYFEIETILAFTLKLAMVERWQKLDAETGKEMFEKLVGELTSTFEMQEM